MPPFKMMALPLAATLVLTSVWTLWQPGRAQQSPPPVVAEELRHAQSDFAAGGIRKLSGNWNACIDRARASQDANVAEHCIVYGYGALLLSDSDVASNRTPWMRHLTADIVGPGHIEMLEIMGIPVAPRQAWLDRYHRWVSESTDAGASDIGGAAIVRQNSGEPRIATPTIGEDGSRGAQIDLAKAADGKYPREAVRLPGIADALRQLVGQSLLERLKDYSFGGPMEFTGRYTVGTACEPRACGVSEARYVFSPEDVWIGIIDRRRMRIYGNPPKSARALLLRDRNQTAWRGPVQEMTHPTSPRPIPISTEAPARGQPPRMTVSPPLDPVSSDPAGRGRSPRMSISPALIPVSADPEPRAQTDSGATEVRLRMHSGTLVVPVMINDAMTLPFAVDSGASDVTISADVMERLIQSGTVSKADFLGKQIYHLADGSRVSSETFRIHTLRVGDREVRDVVGSVSAGVDSLLLGQSFLTRFRSWSIDNQRQVLLLK